MKTRMIVHGQSLGFAMEWHEKAGNKFSVLRVRREADTHAAEQRPAAFEWMLHHMAAIDRVFRPRCRELDDSPLHDQVDA